jgi:hypothetical protein
MPTGSGPCPRQGRSPVADVQAQPGALFSKPAGDGSPPGGMCERSISDILQRDVSLTQHSLKHICVSAGFFESFSGLIATSRSKIAQREKDKTDDIRIDRISYLSDFAHSVTCGLQLTSKTADTVDERFV